MSFGYALGDFVLLTQLAWDVVQNSRKACGAHDDLTSEVTSLHIVLRRLQAEVSKPNAILTRSDDNLDRREELAQLSEDCKRVLRVLDGILEKYNALSEEKRSVTKLWKRVQFGNGEMLDLAELRGKIATSTSALTLFLNLLSLGSQGKVESYMESQGDELRKMRKSLNWITASMQARAPKAGEGSILTTYAGDDKAIWKDFRRELIKEGFSSDLLQRHMETIKEYVMELGSRGALDDIEDNIDVRDLSLDNRAESYESEVTTEEKGLKHPEIEPQEDSEETTVEEPCKSLEGRSDKGSGNSFGRGSDQRQVEQLDQMPQNEAQSGNENDKPVRQMLAVSRAFGEIFKPDCQDQEVAVNINDTFPLDDQHNLEGFSNPPVQTSDDDEAIISRLSPGAVESQTGSDSRPLGFKEEHTGETKTDGGGDNVNSLAGVSPSPRTCPSESARKATKVLGFYYNPEDYVKLELFGLYQRLFGPYLSYIDASKPWNSLSISISPPLFYDRNGLQLSQPHPHRPHFICHWIFYLSLWYDRGIHPNGPSSIFSLPIVLLPIADELQRLLARACVYYTRVQRIRSKALPFKIQFERDFKSMLTGFYYCIRDAIKYGLICKERNDGRVLLPALWDLDRNLHWHQEKNKFVAILEPDFDVKATQISLHSLHELGEEALVGFVHSLFDDEVNSCSHLADFIPSLKACYWISSDGMKMICYKQSVN
jgi:hypothetical protein